MTVTVKHFKALTTRELYEIIKARFNVFYIEQRCFYPDLDDIDYYSHHFFIMDQSKVVAYGRLFPEDETGVWHIGRVLTVRRGEGMGRVLMQKIIDEAWRLGATLLRMDAQEHAIGFYEKLHFTVCSDVFIEAGIPHVRMEMAAPVND